MKVLKWIALLAFVASIFILVLPREAGAVGWYSTSWAYRKAFTVTGSTAGAQTNYQVPITIYYSSGTDLPAYSAEPPIGASYTADTGTGATTIVDTQLTSTVDDFYIGRTIYNITRQLQGTVTDYVAATKTLTTTTIAGQVATDTYRILPREAIVYLDGHIQTDFDDVRITSSDGTTLLDYYVETITTGSVETIWVELNSIPVAPNTATFYLYYGNASASSVSDGADTFIEFEDFEWGANGTLLDVSGGSITWTITTGICEISTIQAYKGTRSGRWAGDATRPVSTFVHTLADNRSYRMRIYKETLASGSIFAGTGTASERFQFGADASENIQVYDDTGIVDTGTDMAADAWTLFDVTNINTTANTFSLFYNGAVVATQPVNLRNDNTLNGVFRFYGVNTATYDWFVDNIMIRNYCNPEPLITSWTTALNLGPNPTINSAAVFRSYIDEGDWLVTVLYTNVYEPYYSAGYNVSELFYLQFIGTDGTTVIAQTKCPAWGMKPGCIYMSADQVSPLTWEDSYIVRVYGNFTGNPYGQYTLVATDWKGTNLILLDAWVRSSAILMENYYSTTLTSYIAGKGITLNEDGGVVFSDGIPELDQVRPNLFQIVSKSPSESQGTYTQTNNPSWQMAWGTQVTEIFTNVGALFNLDGQAIGALIAFTFYALVAIFCFPAGTSIAAIGIPFVILIGAWATGFIAMAILGVILAVAAFFLIWQFWLKGA